MTLWEIIKSWFASPEPINKQPEKIQSDEYNSPQSMQKPGVSDDIDWNDWAAKAAHISSTFEGKGGDYANVTGNFDKAGLTCGLLGLTWRFNNQPPMILEFLSKYGETRMSQLMPKTWREYVNAARLGVDGGAHIVCSWSVGASAIKPGTPLSKIPAQPTAGVKEPYKSELKAFWSSPEMKAMQIKKYETMMGVFAKKKTLEAQKYFSFRLPKFEHYAYFWDQAVLNGTGNTPSFEDHKTVTVAKVLEFVRTVQGFNTSSNRANFGLWSEQVKIADPAELVMFKLAYLRCLKSSKEFQGTTLMRRGTLALGVGVVNGSKREYAWKLPEFEEVKSKTPEVNHSKNVTLIDLAKTEGYEKQMREMLEFATKKGIALGANNWAMVDMRKKSNVKRAFIFSASTKSVSRHYCSHGSGSDPDHTGFALKFSNDPNSNMTPVGFYQCSETYIGKHGESMRLDGLSESNSNARKRAIVIHGASYVGQGTVDAQGKCGRSQGCPALPTDEVAGAISKLKNGSILYIFN